MEIWQTGDKNAFEALFREYERLVFKNAYLIMGKKEEAEDVLQQVFISVWKSRHTFDANKGKLTTWLHRITVNECMKKHRKLEPINEILYNINLMDTSLEPEAALIKQEQYEKMIKAVNSLDKKHKTILILRYFDDLSYEEIANTVDIPIGTVKSRISNGLKRLREQITGQIMVSEECE